MLSLLAAEEILGQWNSTDDSLTKWRTVALNSSLIFGFRPNFHHPVLSIHFICHFQRKHPQ